MFVVGLIIFNTGAFVALDFFRFALFGTPWQFLTYPPIKLLNPFLCLLMVWVIDKNGISPDDSRQLRRIFLLICLADVLFILEWVGAGIIVFSVCQVLLIKRHVAWLDCTVLRERLALLLGVGLLAFSSCTLIFVFMPLMTKRFLLLLMAIYGYVLTISVLVTLLNLKSKAVSRVNAILAATGMICFLACDFTVGLNISLKPGLWWLLSTSLTWVFYSPALVLLAFSGYALKQITGEML